MLTEFFLPIYHSDSRFKGQLFMQDGAPPHFALVVRDLLDQEFPDMWIGRRGPIDWPPRSPDLTPMDFWLWGMIRDQVYSEKSSNLQELKEKITVAFSNVPLEMCQNACLSVRRRLEMCLEQDGGHFENYSYPSQ